MIIGLDEVGRGCWAGPLVAGAAALPEGFVVPEGAFWKLTDSKQLSMVQRERTDSELRGSGVVFGLGWVPVQELDEVGVTKAVTLAMQRAYDAVSAQLGDGASDVTDVIIDGSINYLPDISGTRAVVKADGTISAVSAASVLAKVARDEWMAEAAGRYPGYGFERHVGYGTKAHIQALAELGVCELHRRSFKPIRSFL